MKKKVYISLPITGHENTAKQDAEAFKAILQKELPDAEIKTPFDVCPKENKPYSFYLSRDIEYIMNADAVAFMKNWKFSKGCLAEFNIAKLYGKDIMYQLAVEYQIEQRNNK